MALWGKVDNVLSTGTVSVDYDTLVVTGTATSFGQTGSAQVGDVIRFGVRDGGGGTYFGDARITSIVGLLTCSIASCWSFWRCYGWRLVRSFTTSKIYYY